MGPATPRFLPTVLDVVARTACFSFWIRTGGVIRHCVFVRFPIDLDETEIDALLRGLDAVCAPLDGVLDVRLGPNRSPEVELANGYRHGFVVDFADAAARDAYLVDETHQAFGGRLVAAAEGGIDGIFVFDFALD